MEKQIPKIFIGNIPWIVGKKELRKHFSKFGPLSLVHISFDWETGFSKGYGFVRFKTLEGHEQALKNSQQELEGGTVFVREAVE